MKFFCPKCNFIVDVLESKNKDIYDNKAISQCDICKNNLKLENCRDLKFLEKELSRVIKNKKELSIQVIEPGTPFVFIDQDKLNKEIEKVNLITNLVELSKK